MAVNDNFFLSPSGHADFAILHEPRKWVESEHKSVVDHENGEYSIRLIIGNDEGKHFKSIVDGYVKKKFDEVVEETFAELKKSKPKKVSKFKDAMEWQTAENVFSRYYPYTQLEDEEGEALDAWKFKFRRKCKNKFKKDGQLVEYPFTPKFANKEGEDLHEDYFKANGLIGNESELRIRYKPWAWASKDNTIGVKLELYHVQLIEHVPYKSEATDRGPLFDPVA